MAHLSDSGANDMTTYRNRRVNELMMNLSIYLIEHYFYETNIYVLQHKVNHELLCAIAVIHGVVAVSMECLNLFWK